jgi:hypothetical protein
MVQDVEPEVWMGRKTYNVPSGRVLGEANAVAQAPTEHLCTPIIERCICRQQVIDVEDPHLATNNILLHGWTIQIAIGTARDKQQVRVACERDGQGPSRVRR